jgi:hypothetical protein
MIKSGLTGAIEHKLTGFTDLITATMNPDKIAIRRAKRRQFLIKVLHGESCQIRFLQRGVLSFISLGSPMLSGSRAANKPASSSPFENVL